MGTETYSGGKDGLHLPPHNLMFFLTLLTVIITAPVTASYLRKKAACNTLDTYLHQPYMLFESTGAEGGKSGPEVSPARTAFSKKATFRR